MAPKLELSLWRNEHTIIATHKLGSNLLQTRFIITVATLSLAAVAKENTCRTKLGRLVCHVAGPYDFAPLLQVTRVAVHVCNVTKCSPRLCIDKLYNNKPYRQIADRMIYA